MYYCVLVGLCLGKVQDIKFSWHGIPSQVIQHWLCILSYSSKSILSYSSKRGQEERSMAGTPIVQAQRGINKVIHSNTNKEVKLNFHKPMHLVQERAKSPLTQSIVF
jgi:hypothetical protein